MFVPLRWRFFTGFNVLRSEQEKSRNLYCYLLANADVWIREVTDAIVELAATLVTAGDAVMDFALHIEQDGE